MVTLRTRDSLPLFGVGLEKVPNQVRGLELIGGLAHQKIGELTHAAGPMMAEPFDGDEADFGIVSAVAVNPFPDPICDFVQPRCFRAFERLGPLVDKGLDWRLGPFALISSADR